MSKNCSSPSNPRLGKVGGQAVMEGVMMKSGEKYSVAVLQEDKSITVVDGVHVPAKKKHKILGIPVLRGIINFVETMILSYKTLSVSADAFMGEIEEEETKFEKWLKDRLGAKLMDIVMTIAMILGVCLGLGLFIWLPDLVLDLIEWIGKFSFGVLRALFSGIIKIGIFVLYIFLVSRMSYIRRTFEFHGAEHKSIACFEAGEELTPENARKYSRFHPRCGTSFIFVMMLLGILVFTLVFMIPGANSIWYIRLPLRILLLPLIVGIGYEYIMFAGKHDNAFTRLFSAPGLWMQRLTTHEPDDEQLRVAITALKCAMPDTFDRAEIDAELEALKPKKEESAEEQGESTEEKTENDEN
ncbi:MAG: DUF1385 domain-containing protein [Clostridia bacterium]|nr:DUF1385 domain-containing protein [Clostridia bacterium]